MVPKCPINAQIPYYCSIEGKDRFMFSKLLLLSIEPVFFLFFNYIALLTWSALQTTMNSHAVLGNCCPSSWLTFGICPAANFSLHTGLKIWSYKFCSWLWNFILFFSNHFSNMSSLFCILAQFSCILEALDSSSVTCNYNDHILCKENRAQSIFRKFMKPEILHFLWKWPIFPQFFRCWKTLNLEESLYTNLQNFLPDSYFYS